VTHPTLPALVELLFGSAGVKAPTLFPATDLVAVFATGVDGLNKNVQSGVIGEMVRLNTSIPAVPAAQQKRLGCSKATPPVSPMAGVPATTWWMLLCALCMGVLLPSPTPPSGNKRSPRRVYRRDEVSRKVSVPEHADHFVALEPEITITLQSAARFKGYRSIRPPTTRRHGS